MGSNPFPEGKAFTEKERVPPGPLIIKIPSKLGSLKETEVDEAPNEIVKQLRDFFFIKTFDEREIKVSKDNISETNELIAKEMKRINEFFIALGGDHSITYPVVKSLKKPFLVWLDAHPDCENSFFPPSQEDVVRALVEKDLVGGVLMLGIRNWSEEERVFIKKNKINVFSADEIYERGMKRISEDVMSILRDKKFYVSLDMDVFDPGFAPGVDWPEPGGLCPREVIYLLRKLKKLKGLIGMDIVEVDPKKDVDDMTSRLAARIIAELIKKKEDNFPIWT